MRLAADVWTVSGVESGSCMARVLQTCAGLQSGAACMQVVGVVRQPAMIRNALNLVMLFTPYYIYEVSILICR